ncbi:MAG: type IV pilin [Candidatus Poseidoniaceae archaeon]|nr:type IV pilin [Candidatus Poseidoniaceae archaeon]
MTFTLSDTANPPSYMPNYELLEQQGYAPNNYQQESVSVTLSVEVDNVVENVPDYYLDETEGFSFNGVSNVMPGTYVPVDFSIHAGGDDGDYTYDHLLVVSLHSDGHTEVELPQYFTPPAFGESLDIEDWEVYITDLTTEVWVEVDVVTCTPNPAGTCTVNEVQTDNPESHNAISSSQVFGKWSEPGRIGEDANGQQSNRRPAFEDKNWCNNMMSTNGGNEVAWSESSSCQHTEQGYNGAFGQDWQTADVALPVTVTTIGALSVASFAPSIIAVALTGLFVSALVLAGRRDDDEEEFVEEQISDDDAAVSPVIATILMVAITVVLSGVVYVWAAQLADTDTKGVPRVTFTAENVDTGSVETDHWKITVGQAQTVLATQAVEVTVIYLDANGVIVSETTNLASTDHVYGFSPFNSDSLVTFGDVVTIDEDETISSFSTGDDIYVKTQTADGHKLVDATVRIVYSPGGDNQGAVLKTYSGLTWNQPV